MDYQELPDPPGHASITTFTTNGSELNFYAHYATADEDGTLQYHQYPVNSMSLVKSHDEYKEGRRWIRNTQDNAKEQSEGLKDQLKAYYKKQRSGGKHPIAQDVPAVPEPSSGPPRPSVDEDGYEVVVEQDYQPTPPISTKHKGGKAHPHHSHYLRSVLRAEKPSASPHGPSKGSSHKRKASSSEASSSGSPSSSSQRSKFNKYWKRDRMTGRYCHTHANGTVSWLDDGEDEDGS